MSEGKQIDMDSQGCGSDHSGSRDEAALVAAAPLTKGGLGVWHYRGWTITPDEFGGGWTACSENYDADYQGEEDGFVDNGEKVLGASVSACCDAIDAWVEEAEEAERSEERANHDGGDV